MKIQKNKMLGGGGGEIGHYLHPITIQIARAKTTRKLTHKMLQKT